MQRKLFCFLWRSEDELLSFTILSVFIILMVQYFVISYFNLFDSPTFNKITFISKIFSFIIYLCSFPIVIKKRIKWFIIIYSFSISLYLITFLIYKNNFLFALAIQNLFISLPMFLYIISIDNLQIFTFWMEKVAYILFLISFAVALSILKNINNFRYSMSYSYYLLFPSIFFINKYFNTFKFKYLFIFLIIFLEIISFGSRGPLLSISFFLFFKVFEFFKKTKFLSYRGWMLAFFILLFIPILILNYKFIIICIVSILNKYGINSRTLDLLYTNIYHLSGRNSIYLVALSAISARPFVGYGIGGDRELMHLFFGNSFYVHDIFLELFIDFGIIISSILLFLFIFTIFKVFLKSKSPVESQLLLMWFSIAFIPLLVSGSYLTDFNFWIFLGLIFRIAFINSKKASC